MGQDDTLAALVEILADVARIGPAHVTPRARFDDLGIDSLRWSTSSSPPRTGSDW